VQNLTRPILAVKKMFASVPFPRNLYVLRDLKSGAKRQAQMSVVEDRASRAIVLVVEDEWFLRRHAVEMIEDAGYEVLEAGNADDAIRILETTEGIRVIFTDIQMPDSSTSKWASVS
jgi:PleD family two-component response regulator